MLHDAEVRGELTPGKTVIEATSGNTGIGLAMVCAVKGYPCICAMSESASEERKLILKALGAQILLTPAPLGTDGAIEEVYRLAREFPDKYYLPDQFNNPAIPWPIIAARPRRSGTRPKAGSPMSSPPWGPAGPSWGCING